MIYNKTGYSSALQASVDYAWFKSLVIVAAVVNDGSSVPGLADGDCFVIFFFKQNTAYELPLCDWSSDVCSSDLATVEKTPYRKCARCWRHRESVGQSSAHPDLCDRCESVVASAKKMEGRAPASP